MQVFNKPLVISPEPEQAKGREKISSVCARQRSRHRAQAAVSVSPVTTRKQRRQVTGEGVRTGGLSMAGFRDFNVPPIGSQWRAGFLTENKEGASLGVILERNREIIFGVNNSEPCSGPDTLRTFF